MANPDHERFMRRAIELAARAGLEYGTGAPYGAVVVKDNKITNTALYLENRNLVASGVNLITALRHGTVRKGSRLGGFVHGQQLTQEIGANEPAGSDHQNGADKALEFVFCLHIGVEISSRMESTSSPHCARWKPWEPKRPVGYPSAGR